MPFGGGTEGGVAATIFAVTDSLPSKSVGEAVQTITANEIKSEVEVNLFYFFFRFFFDSTSCDRQCMRPFLHTAPENTSCPYCQQNYFSGGRKGT